MRVDGCARRRPQVWGGGGPRQRPRGYANGPKEPTDPFVKDGNEGAQPVDPSDGHEPVVERQREPLPIGRGPMPYAEGRYLPRGTRFDPNRRCGAGPVDVPGPTGDIHERLQSGPPARHEQPDRSHHVVMTIGKGQEHGTVLVGAILFIELPTSVAEPPEEHLRLAVASRLKQRALGVEVHPHLRRHQNCLETTWVASNQSRDSSTTAPAENGLHAYTSTLKNRRGTSHA